MRISLNSLTLSCARLASVVGLSLLFGGAIIPATTFAAEMPQCTCFCGTNAKGAKETDPKTALDSHTCAARCADAGQYFVGCYEDPAKFPKGNDECWTEKECGAWLPGPGVTTSKPVWGGQYFSCAPDYGRCYAPSRATNLNVPILGVTSVYGFPEYLNIVYKFLLGAAAVAAVLMITLAGFKWTTARGNSKELQHAKDRIRDVVIGLLLLFSAVSIAKLIDPRLSDFNAVKVPLSKAGELVPASLFCEELHDNYGYVITPDSTNASSSGGSSVVCGSKGRITTLPTDNNVVSNTYKIGTACYYKGGNCSDGTECRLPGAGDYQAAICVATTTPDQRSPFTGRSR